MYLRAAFARTDGKNDIADAIADWCGNTHIQDAPSIPKIDR